MIIIRTYECSNKDSFEYLISADSVAIEGLTSTTNSSIEVEKYENKIRSKTFS